MRMSMACRDTSVSRQHETVPISPNEIHEHFYKWKQRVNKISRIMKYTAHKKSAHLRKILPSCSIGTVC